MKEIVWSHTTSRHFHEKHHISIADIAHAIRSDGLLDIIETHRPEQYQEQRLYIVQLRGEIYVAPFRETETHIVLITAWPSRKFRKRYLR